MQQFIFFFPGKYGMDSNSIQKGSSASDFSMDVFQHATENS